MARHFSMDDSRVGRGSGKFFKVVGTKEHPQRIAYVPAEAHQHELVVSDELKKRASRQIPDEIRQRAFKGDERARALLNDVEQAQQQIEDIMALKDVITERLRAKTPSAEIWTNENGQKVILYPRTEMVVAFWVDDVGQVMFKEGMPLDLCGDRGPENLYGLVLIEYELEQDGEVRILPRDRQLDVGNGDRLDFKYFMKPWSVNQYKVDTWKEHSRKNPLIFCDYEIYTEKVKKYSETKFTPAGPAVWRKNPGVMRRIVREARKFYAELERSMARDFSVEELIKLVSGDKRGSSSDYDQDAATPGYVEEMDFAAMLGQPLAIEQGGSERVTNPGGNVEQDLSVLNVGANGGDDYHTAAAELDAMLAQNEQANGASEDEALLDFGNLIP
jgi:hypothetical protein